MTHRSLPWMMALYLTVMVGWLLLSLEYSRFGHAVFALNSWGDSHHNFWLIYLWALSFLLCVVPAGSKIWVLGLGGLAVPLVVSAIKLGWVLVSPELVDSNPNYYSSHVASSLAALYFLIATTVVFQFHTG